MTSKQNKSKHGIWQVALVFIVCLISKASIAQDIAAGKALFKTNCAACHGENGDGNGPAADQLVLKARDFSMAAFKFDTNSDWERGTDEDLADVIRNGAAIYGGADAMVPWGHLSDEEIKGLISYIRSLEAQ
jgi:mono/diheme cytochrome c family protein